MVDYFAWTAALRAPAGEARTTTDEAPVRHVAEPRRPASDPHPQPRR